MKITALDFETANPRKGSICSVGIVVYEDGREVDAYETRIRPHDSLGNIWPFYTAIHGITNEELEFAPELPDIWEDLNDYFSGADVVVCHNAGFDINQLRAAVSLYGMTTGDFPYVCTVMASRKLYPGLKNHKLDTMAEFIRHPLNHHDALDDARVAGALLVHMLGAHSLHDWAGRHGIRIRRFKE